MAEVIPLKIADTGSGTGALQEFAAGDTLPKAALPALTGADVGLPAVDNTPDSTKPVSGPQATALGLKVDKVAGMGLSQESFTTGEKSKLSAIATGATANDTDANLRDRANHTGTQLAATISDFAATVRSTVLTGLAAGTNTVIAATDTLLASLAKLQAQITARAMKGVNNDITELQGLTVPLTVGQGGTGSATGVATMVGATASANGTKGLAPAPLIADKDKFLKGDGTYGSPSGSGSGLAVGSPQFWYLPEASLPAGGIANNGQILDRATWPDLWALYAPYAVTDAVWLAAPYLSRGLPSAGNGTSTFRMPDTNGKHSDGNTPAAAFLRGYGKNSAGTPGMFQLDQLQGFRMRTPQAYYNNATGNLDGSSNSGSVAAYNAAGETTAPRARTGPAETDGVNGTPRVGTETRSTNVTVIWYTVGAGAVVNPGLVDVTALATTVATHTSQIANKLDATDLGYVYVYPGGTSAAPANISNNTRIIVTNPFPGSPVIAQVELRDSGIWAEPGWDGNSGSASNAYGARAGQIAAADQIIIQTGASAVIIASAGTGGLFASISAGLVYTAPVRVKIFKLKGTL